MAIERVILLGRLDELERLLRLIEERMALRNGMAPGGGTRSLGGLPSSGRGPCAAGRRKRLRAKKPKQRASLVKTGGPLKSRLAELERIVQALVERTAVGSGT